MERGPHNLHEIYLYILDVKFYRKVVNDEIRKIRLNKTHCYLIITSFI